MKLENLLDNFSFCHTVKKVCPIWIYETTKSIAKTSQINGIGTLHRESATHGRTSIRCRPNQIPATVSLRENKFLDLWVCCVNMGTLRGTSGETEIERRSVAICCVQKTRFMGFRRKPVRMISRKVAEYKVLWIKMKKF